MTPDHLIAAHRLRARAEPDYLPPCPACSGYGVTAWPEFWYGRHQERWAIGCGWHCLLIARIQQGRCRWFVSREAAGRRWRAVRRWWWRQEAGNEIAIRRRQQFRASGLEYLTAGELARALAALEHPAMATE